MTWKVDEIELSFGGPSGIQRRVLRKQTANKILEQFPFPVDTGPDAFELQLKGMITPALLADQLWEKTKAAEQPELRLEVSNDPEFEFYTGNYAVNRSTIGMSKPRFDSATGKIVQDYNITFVQFAEDIGNGDTGDKGLDEPGVGFADIPENFGDFIFDTFQLTFGDLFA